MDFKIILLLPFIFQTTFIFGQSLLSTDTSVKVFPHWKKGESHSVKIKSFIVDSRNEKIKNYKSFFDASFYIAEKDTSGYTIEWTYNKCTLASDEPSVENIIIGNLTDKKIIFKLSLTGRFKELINTDEIKSAVDKTIDNLIVSSADNNALNSLYKMAKKLISTRQGLEIALLKQIKFYNFSFGFNYRLNFIQTNNLKLPNPLGGQPFDAVEKVILTKLDNPNSVCIIETNKNVDAHDLKNEVVEYLKKITTKDSSEIESELKNEKLAFSEKTMQQIDFSKGLIQKSNFTRKINFGFQNRTASLEIETVN